MSLIKLTTADQRLELVSAPKITSGNTNVDFLSVELDDTWNYSNLSVKARFHTDGGEGYITAMTKQGSSEYQCRVPNEAEVSPGILFIGIFGEAEGSVVKTTNEIHLTVAPGTSTAGQVLTALLPEIIALLKRKISSAISDDISAEEAKDIIESNLSLLSDLKAAYSQLVLYVNNYQNTDYSSNDIENIGNVCRHMWDLGVQLSEANADAAAYREALERYMANMSGQDEITLDGSTELIIDEVGSELESLIAELEALRATNDAVTAVFENFYIGAEANGNT